MRRAFVYPFAAALLFVATQARAGDPAADDPQPEAPRAQAQAPKPWVWNEDASLPQTAAAYSRVSYAQSTARPFVSDVAHPGAVIEAGAEASILPRLSIVGAGLGGGDGWGASGGLRVAVVATETTRLALATGASRTFSGAAGAWARASFEQDVGRFRMGAAAQGEHVFQEGRDGVDMLVSAAASARVVGPLRLGAEWVGQDLEASVDREEAEGGMRCFAGPTASLELLGRRLAIGAGPSFGLTPGSPALLARGQLAYAF